LGCGRETGDLFFVAVLDSLLQEGLKNEFVRV
jgi:hypothetical protein